MDKMTVMLISLDGLSKLTQVPKNQKLVIKTKTSPNTYRSYLFYSWYQNCFLKNKIRVFREAKFSSEYVQLAEDIQASFFG